MVKRKSVSLLFCHTVYIIIFLTINAFNHKSFYSFHLKFAVFLEQNIGPGEGEEGVLSKIRKYSALVICLLNRLPGV